ncbi:MAG: VWA domain-containing protein [Anaerolineales bacterium]|nr:VWA domain-containing protein [Anaerolineales bacterium]
MRHDYTHISVILDRTGSMETIRDDTIGGFNAFLNEQKSAAGYATMTLVQFDSQDPYEVLHKFAPVTAVTELTRSTFVPRASTPLLDAIGRGVNDLEQSLSQMPEAVRPSRVVMVVITDGQENASREFRKDQIAKMIAEKQEKLDWQFVFLSADLDAINDALAAGVRSAAVMAFDKNEQGTRSAWASTSSRILRARANAAERVEFTEEDRAKQAAEKERE